MLLLDDSDLDEMISFLLPPSHWTSQRRYSAYCNSFAHDSGGFQIAKTS